MNLKSRIKRASIQAEKTRARLEKTFSVRIALAGVAFALLILLSLEYRHFGIVLGLAFVLIIFAYFVRVSQKLRRQLEGLKVIESFFERQCERIEGQPPAQAMPVFPKTPEANDLDLFGEHSLFSQINECQTLKGQDLLAQWMTHASLVIEEIKGRQQKVQLLSKFAGYLRRVIVLTQLEQKNGPLNDQGILKLLETPMIDSAFHRRHLILWVLFSLYILAGIINISLGVPLPVGGVWLAYFVFSLYSLGKTSEIFGQLQSTEIEFQKLLPVLSKIEKLDPKVQKIITPNLFEAKPSKAVRKIQSLLSFLSIQTHPLVHILINGFIPWSYFFSARTESHRLVLKETLPKALKDLYQFEALSTLALMYRYQTQVFPIFSSEILLEVRSAYHPLIQKAKRVPNTFNLSGEKRLALLTGSNMSGKSTFLRTLGMNQILALMGAPVFAEGMNTSVCPVRSCIRVSDSVRDGYSYFYAETLRLRDILNEARAGRPVFFLIDEMFRGTNNRERLVGSQGYIGALIKTSSIGLISSHDLELTALEKSQSALANYHFRDDIDDSGIHFSYTLQKGPCPSTNALKIMASVGIPVSEPN